MITEQTYHQTEAEISKLFAEAGWNETPLPNDIRIQKIEERVIHERIAKESVDFIFIGFGSVLSNFSRVFLGSIEDVSEDYKV